MTPFNFRAWIRSTLGHKSPRRSYRKTGRTRLGCELLEDRLTPAITVTDTLTAVTFTGDGANNALTVRLVGDRIEYSANGAGYVALANARADALTSLVVNGGSGNDTFDLSQLGSGLTALAARGLGAAISGGSGNDFLHGTGLNDTITGGPGTDTLHGSSGDDLLNAMDWEADTLDGGLGRDAAYFESTDPGPVSVEVWNPFTPAADNQRHKVKVLVLNYNPQVPSRGNRLLTDVYNWTDPSVITAAYEEAFERTSGGYIDFEITDWRNLNAIPVKADGFVYTPDQYVQLWDAGDHTQFHQPDLVDYPRMMAENRVPELVDAGLVDEVWYFGAPYFGGYESAMMGPGSFWINGAAYPQVPSSRAFAVHTFNYERFADVLMHGTGHRTESTMQRVYGGWNLANPTSNWDKFAANAHQSNGVSGAGSAHFPANGQSDYDYTNTRTVSSWADDFLDYPSMDWTTRPVDRESWGRLGGTEFYPGGDYQQDYFQWWYTRFPRSPGTNADGRQNNWWKHLFDFNNYTATGQPLPLRVHQTWAADVYNSGGTAYTFTVAYSGAVPVDVASLGDTDVTVTAPGGTVLSATLVGVSDPTNGTYRVATYRVTPPGGTWDVSDRGLYTIRLVGNQVRNSAGDQLTAQVLGTFQVRTAAGGPLPNDADTRFLLRLDGNLTSVGGGNPSSSGGVTFAAGLVGQGAVVAPGGGAVYPVAGNLPATAGTIEFWVRPDWNAADTGPNDHRTFFTAGAWPNNSLTVYFDSWDNSVRLDLTGDNPATGVVETNYGRQVSTGSVGWTAGTWQHVAATWDATGRMSIYLNGQQRDARADGPVLNGYSASTFRVFGNPGQTGGGVFDEYRISSRARPAGEIASDYRTAVTLSGLTLSDTALTVRVSDPRRLTATAGGLDVTPSVRWTTSNPAVAVVDENGTVRGLTAGTATITATLDTLTASAGVTVTDPGRPTATLTAAAVVTAPGTAAYQFTVTYADPNGLAVDWLNGADVRVVGPNGYSRFAELVSVSPAGNGSPRTAAYRIIPPSGDWDYTDNGTYRIELTGWQVADADNVFAAANTLGTFTVLLPRPTVLGLSNATVAEGMPVNTVVGTLAATDPDTTRTFTYALVAGAGNNALFTLSGSALRTAAVFDFETQASYTVVVRATDQFGQGKNHTLSVGVTVSPPPVSPPPVSPPPVTPPPVSPPPVNPLPPPRGGGRRLDLFAVAAGPGGGPHVRVYNPDGSDRFSFFAYAPNFTGGLSVATGDVTGDGIDDIITGALSGGGPHVQVFDGTDLRVVRSFFAYDPAFRGGVQVAGGDVTGDGIADIVTSAGAGGGPHVQVIDGVTGAVVHSFFAYDPAFRGGVRATAGDVTGDGIADIATSAGSGGGPHVKVFDGRTLAEVRSLFAFDQSFGGGVNVFAGDVTGDGVADLICGMAGQGSRVRVIDGVTGGTTAEFEPFDGFPGGVRVTAADMTEDGSAEVVVGAGPAGGPRFQVWTGGGVRLFDRFAYDPGFTRGIAVG